MAANSSHRSDTLFRASFQRLTSAWVCRTNGDHAMAMYLGGLAVGCILQALAFQTGAVHDARHDLEAWLDKATARFVTEIRGSEMAHHWDRIVAVWHNNLRYFDRAALLGHLRSFDAWRAFRGDDDARMKQASKSFLESAATLHAQGTKEWRRKDKS